MLLQELVAWADHRPDVRAIVLIGSHVSGTARPDSDVDLIILTENPDELLTDTSWTNRFGAVVAGKLEHWGRVTSVRVWYDDLEAELGIARPDWASSPDEGTKTVLAAGFRVLVDRDDLFKRFR